MHVHCTLYIVHLDLQSQLSNLLPHQSLQIDTCPDDTHLLTFVIFNIQMSVVCFIGDIYQVITTNNIIPLLLLMVMLCNSSSHKYWFMSNSYCICLICYMYIRSDFDLFLWALFPLHVCCPIYIYIYLPDGNIKINFVFQTVTVSNSAIWLVLSAVRIFLSLTTVTVTLAWVCLE